MVKYAPEYTATAHILINHRHTYILGVLVTENIKNFVDSPVADVLTAIIPGDIDDEIKNWLRAKLPTILAELKLADSCSALTDPTEIHRTRSKSFTRP